MQFRMLAASVAALALAFGAAAAQASPQALFYMMNTPKSVASFEAHIDKIGVLVPTWYGVDKNGLVSGGPNPGVLAEAKAAHVPVTPIISLTDRPALHQLLTDPAAQSRMAEAMAREVKLHGYAGFHFDFENIDYRDRDAFTAMTGTAAAAMHKVGATLAVAVCPNAPGYPGQGGFSKWMWEYWRGAYDLKGLAAAADSISLMTYDQHTRWTTPGPVAGMPWVLQNLDYAVAQGVPKSKLSLGIALYGYRWYAENPVRPDGTEQAAITGAYIDADESLPMIRQYGIQLQWDPVDQEAFFFFYRDQMREWVFMPEARAFGARYELVKSRGLEGFSAWVLGSEDSKIWDLLPKARP